MFLSRENGKGHKHEVIYSIMPVCLYETNCFGSVLSTLTNYNGEGEMFFASGFFSSCAYRNGEFGMS